MGRLIVPRHTADLDYIFGAIKVYYDDGDWVNMTDYKNRLVSHLLATGKETKRSGDDTHYTKCSEVPRYFGFLERRVPGDINSDVRITPSGVDFYDSYVSQQTDRVKELILEALENITFGRNNEGVGSDSDVESPNVAVVASLLLNGLSNKELAFILGRMNDYDISAANAISQVLYVRNSGSSLGSSVTKDNKPILFMKRLEFFKPGQNDIVISDDVLAKYYDRLAALPLTNNATSITGSQQKSSIDDSQIIYYGAPGTGKSYKIKHEVLAGIDESVKPTVTFYPDYNYSDFIGGLRPVSVAGRVTYEFVPGPFSQALLHSFIEPVYLIIEEINRGNPAAIFGDMFQLLDRRDDGRSLYEVTNADLYDYLVKNGIGMTAILPKGKVFLPQNLHILCSMNTADQNVFVLDTAFKRRFRMEYVPIDFSKLDPNNPKTKDYCDKTAVFQGTRTLSAIFANTVLSDFITKNPQFDKERTWSTFAQIVNERINLANKDGDSISEDKKLGPFFVSKEEIKDKKKFADKVLYYLKQDVFKYIDRVFPQSYQELYDDFVNKQVDLFELLARDK